MAYNYARERKKFVDEWKRKRAEYTAAGMDSNTIEEMYQFDLTEFRKNRSYFTHTVPMLPVGFDDDNGEDKSTFVNRFREATSVYDDYCSTTRYGWIDDIDNPLIVKKLKELSLNDIELLTLIVFDGFSQRDVAAMKMVSQFAISKKIQRIKKFLKFF